MDTYDHVVYGRVTIQARYADFWMAITSSGVKSVYETDLIPVAVAEVLEFPPATPAPAEPVTPAPPPASSEPLKTVTNVNSTSYNLLARIFPALSKITWRRLKEAQITLEGAVFKNFEQFSKVLEGLVEEPVDLMAVQDYMVFSAEDE
jgi:hypothetical protein